MVVVRTAFWTLSLVWVLLYLALGVQREQISSLEAQYKESLLLWPVRATPALREWLDSNNVVCQTTHGVEKLSYTGDMATWVELVNRLANMHWLSWKTQRVAQQEVSGELTIKDL